METRKRTVFELLKTALGLFIFSFGVYLTIRGNIGLAPWDCLSTGVSYHVPLSYGGVHTIISLVILGIDLLMREKIGYGTVLDALMVGGCVDFFTWLGLVQDCTTLLSGALMMIGGLFIMAFGQLLYMSAGQCCGPRDTFMVGVGKRLPRVPIGVVEIGILCAVLAVAAVLGGPVGLGTILAAFGIGIAMQIVFSLFRFEPRDVAHRGLVECTRLLLTGEKVGQPEE